MTKSSDRRNILIIHQHFCPPGGFGNNRSYEVAQHLATLGHTVTVLCGAGNFQQQPENFFTSTNIDGIQVDCIGIGYDHHMNYLRRVLSFITFFLSCCRHVSRYKKNTDVIYAVSTPISVGLIGLWFQRILKKPVFFEIGDLWPDVPVQMGILKNKLFISFLYKLESFIYQKSKHIVLLSEGMKEYLLKKNIPEEKFTVLCNGTNTGQFAPAVDKAILRKQYDLPTDTFIVLYAGTMGLANRLELFIDAAEKVGQTGNPQIRFYFIGNGNRLTEIKSLVENKKLSNVSFIESVPKAYVSDYFKLADAGIVSFASFKILETNSANKYYDYLACGLPVVINYGGWQKQALEKNHCGFSVSTAAQAAETFVTLLSDPELYRLMSANARALAVREYNRKEIALRLSKLILQHS
ncbi:MAG: glycosyltransferase family 4 protein [Cytophaga sp.]|uniref:glycosyltransferase family 4 protein n=1 Tax=Cytophaga sp. TaxID=29535 RepID=UPI003F815574